MAGTELPGSLKEPDVVERSTMPLMRRSWHERKSLVNTDSEVSQALIRVAELVERDAHPIHQRQVEAAQLAVLVAGLRVIEVAAGLQCAADRAGGEDRQLAAVVVTARPHVRQEDEARVVEDRAVPFRHRRELVNQVDVLP